MHQREKGRKEDKEGALGRVGEKWADSAVKRVGWLEKKRRK